MKMPELNLGDYSGVVVSISGGKDSQTILGVVVALATAQAYAGTIFAVHADTGAEWTESLPHCRLLCEHYHMRLEVAVPYRALPDHIERRCRMVSAAGGAAGWPDAKNRYCTSHCKTDAIAKVIRAGWPSAACRYCTSDCKRAPIQRAVRIAFPRGAGARVLSVTGERRQESSHRAKLPEIDPNKALSIAGREVVNWRPILDYRLEDVWAHIAATGLPRHVAYDRGNERLSCALCVLAKDADIRNGALARPDLAERFLSLERETGQTFKNGKSLAEILAFRPAADRQPELFPG